MQIETLNINYLENDEAVDAGGLKLHVDELKLRGGIGISTPETVGEVLPPPLVKTSVSLIVAKDRGERTTEPGVILGSSSMLFICVPYNIGLLTSCVCIKLRCYDLHSVSDISVKRDGPNAYVIFYIFLLIKFV